MIKHIPIIDDFGGAPFAEHDVICPICIEQSAVYLLNDGIFLPCWKCQHDGWITHRLPKWLSKVIKFWEKK